MEMEPGTAACGFSVEEYTMEAACFLSSRSFTKTVELMPSIKDRVLCYPRKNSNQFVCRKFANPSSVTCCQLNSWSPSDEGSRKVSEDADWRAFRARLVAGERASRPEDSSSWTNPDTVEDYPPPILIGDKWAHPIYQPEKGCLLIATEKLDGVHIFERTVILLLSVGSMGPSGIILNRPSLMSIKETKSTVLDLSGTFSDRPLYFGGPLEEGLFLVSPKEEDDREDNNLVFKEVMKGLYYGTKESVGCAAEMVKSNLLGTGDFRFFDGYCGWERDQLNQEIMAGYWTIAACSPSVVGLSGADSHGLWNEILGLMDRRKVW